MTNRFLTSHARPLAVARKIFGQHWAGRRPQLGQKRGELGTDLGQTSARHLPGVDGLHSAPARP